jgi:hypothetical protein
MAMCPVVSGQRRRRASNEQRRMDMEDVTFWRALVLEGSASISFFPQPPPPTVSPADPSPAPSAGFPTKMPSVAPTLPPTKSPTLPPSPSPTIIAAPTPMVEPTVSYEPSLSGFPTNSPTASPTVSAEPSVSYEPSGSEEPCKSICTNHMIHLDITTHHYFPAAISNDE